MSKGLSIETNAPEVFQRFEDLSDKELKKYLKQGLRKVLKPIRDDARQNLRGRVNNANRRNPKYSDTLIQGVRMTKIWENKQGASAGEIVGKVRIDSTRDSGSGSFRLPIIDKGSYKAGIRYQYTRDKTRKPKAVGRMKPTNFFQDIIQSKESYFYSEMRKAIDDGVNSVNQKL